MRNRRLTFKAKQLQEETTTMPSRFTKDCEAYKVLEGLFADGTITADTRPKEILKGPHEDVFKEFSDTVFRTHFNRMKAEKGVLLRNDSGKMTVAEKLQKDMADRMAEIHSRGEECFPPGSGKSQGFVVPAMLNGAGNLKPAPVAAAAAAASASATNPFVTPGASLKQEEDDDGLELILPSLLCTVGDSESSRKKQIMLTQMPSGVTNPEQWKSSVVGDGWYYRCNVKQHKTMMDPVVLACAIPENVDPAFHFFAKDAINAALREMCGGKRKDLAYTFKKKLDFKCETKILVEQPATFNGCTFLLVVLQAVEEDAWNLTNEANKMVDLNEKMAKMKEKGV